MFILLMRNSPISLQRYVCIFVKKWKEIHISKSLYISQQIVINLLLTVYLNESSGHISLPYNWKNNHVVINKTLYIQFKKILIWHFLTKNLHLYYIYDDSQNVLKYNIISLFFSFLFNIGGVKKRKGSTFWDIFDLFY